jgi:hypothetical protein
LPANAVPELLRYSELGRFAKHVARWEEAFGADRVHLVLLGDLESRPEATCTLLFRELGLRDVPGHVFPHLNPARRVGAAALLAPLNSASVTRSVVRALVPRRARRYAWHRLTRALTPVGQRPPVDAAVRARLELLFAPDVALIDRRRTASAPRAGPE